VDDLIEPAGHELHYRPHDRDKYSNAVMTLLCAVLLSALTILPLLSDQQKTRKNEVPPPNATTKWWSAPERFEDWRYPWEACGVIWGLSGLLVLWAAFTAGTTRGFTFDSRARTIVSWRIRFGRAANLKTWPAAEFTEIHLYAIKWTGRRSRVPIKSFGIELRGRHQPLNLNGGCLRRFNEVQALADHISRLLGYKVVVTDKFPDLPESIS